MVKDWPGRRTSRRTWMTSGPPSSGKRRTWPSGPRRATKSRSMSGFGADVVTTEMITGRDVAGAIAADAVWGRMAGRPACTRSPATTLGAVIRKDAASNKAFFADGIAWPDIIDHLVG